MNIEHYWDIIVPYATHIALRILGAIILWIVGRWLIRFVDKMVRKALLSKHVDATVAKYAASALGIVLTVALVVAILGYFGIQTTTFAAIALGGTAAIGLAWGGLLANFAAGIFLIVLRPYRVGDFVQIQDTMGTVEEIGLFFTAINTLNNDRIYQNAPQCSAYHRAAISGVVKWRYRPQGDPSGRSCCQVYCLSTDRGAPPTVRMQ